MTKDTEPRCNHSRSEVIVTNQPQAYDRSRPHMSTWVCGRAACVMDAMACVIRFTDEKPWWRIGVDGEWSDRAYVGEDWS